MDLKVLRHLSEALRQELAENPGGHGMEYPSGRAELIGFQKRKKIVGRKHKRNLAGASMKRLLAPPKPGL